MSAFTALIHFLNLVLELIRSHLRRKRLRKIRKTILKKLDKQVNDRLNTAEQSRRRQHDMSADSSSLHKDDGFRRN